MRLSRVLLAASLLANAALAIAIVRRSDHGAGESAKGISATATPAAAGKTLGPAAAAKPPELDPATKTLVRNLAKQDIRSLVAALRTAGFPERVIRSIVQQRFELDRERLGHEDLDTPYWKNPADAPADRPELEKLTRDNAALMKELFGADADTDDEGSATRYLQFGNIPADKIAAIEAIQMRFHSQLEDVMHRSTLSPDTVAVIGAINEQIHAEIAKTLTPDELREWDLRYSPAAARLRNDLAGFNATEAEFRALYPLYAAYTAAAPDQSRPPTPEEVATWRAARQQLNDQIKQLLPPERYADFELASRPENRAVNELVGKLGLPLTAGAAVVAVQRDTLQKAMAIRAQADLTDDARTELLSALRDDAKSNIAAAIGARGLEGYRQSGGQWLDQLVARPNAPAPRKKR